METKYLNKVLILGLTVVIGLFLSPISEKPLLAQETEVLLQQGVTAASVMEEPSDVFQPAQRIHIHINVPATRLDLYVNGQYFDSYPIAIGSPRYKTPVKDFYITRIEWNPSWYPPDSDWAKDASITPPGPNNPLGAVKLVMQNGILIHGTNKPHTVGRAASHGCMRMHKQDVTDLAWMIQSNYSEKTDPTLRETYDKNRRRTYVIKLLEEVPVSIEYSQVELKNERVLLHPNRYWQKGFQDQLEEVLAMHPEIQLDAALVKKLDKMRTKKTVELSIEELKVMSSPVSPVREPQNPGAYYLGEESFAASPAH